MCASVGFFGIGLFSEDRTTPLGLHLFFSYVVFGSFAFSSLFNGVVLIAQNQNFKLIYSRIIGVLMLFVNVPLTILFMVIPPLLPEQFMEWIILFSIFAWILPVAITIRKNLEL